MIAVAQSGGTPSQVYTLKIAYRIPQTVATPQVLVADEGGGPIPMALAPCTPGSCEIDLLHPAPAGDRWVQFESVSPLAPSGVDGQTEMSVEVDFGVPLPLTEGSSLPACTAVGLTGELVGTWHSDDRDTLYGIPVTDFFGEMIVVPSSPNVPALSVPSLAGLAISISIAGILGLWGRARPASRSSHSQDGVLSRPASS